MLVTWETRQECFCPENWTLSTWTVHFKVTFVFAMIGVFLMMNLLQPRLNFPSKPAKYNISNWNWVKGSYPTLLPFVEMFGKLWCCKMILRPSMQINLEEVCWSQVPFQAFRLFLLGMLWYYILLYIVGRYLCPKWGQCCKSVICINWDQYWAYIWGWANFGEC